ncbi:MAG: amidohydrolase family protein [Beijerinckiaceae bacterium]
MGAAGDTAEARATGRRIVDAHHHLWDPVRNYHPWLRDEPMIPFRYGDYSAIRRPYLTADYRSDAAPWVIDASVYVETEWDPADADGEMRFVSDLRRATGLPTVAVAQAWLDQPDCASVLEQHAARGFVRSVRHKPRANPHPQQGSPGGLTDTAFRDGVRTLQPLGLRFDLQTPWWHLGEARQLADDFPSTQIILNHAGLPADRSPEGIAGWHEAMQILAGAPNVAVKISGLGQKGLPWTAAANRAIVLAVIDLFGVERCMFASNFPVDSLCASFATIFGGFESIVGDFGEAEKDALFAANARRIYAIGERHGQA